MRLGVVDTRKITCKPSGISRSRSTDSAGGSVGPSVSNLLKVLIGSTHLNNRRTYNEE